MKDGRFDDAASDYGAAYELSKDPALFFKIGRANERAGKCGVALIYYARYLREGNPSEQFIATTKERILACGGELRGPEGGAAPVEPHPGRGSGSAAPVAADSGSAPREASSADSAAGSATGSGDVAAGAAGGSATPVTTPSDRHKVAWIMTGGAVALAALGGVLTYAASSSENDVRDLYVGFAGQPATFDAETRSKYDDLVGQGHRYQHLSWAALGLAGAAAAGAAVLFIVGGHHEAAQHARVTPVVTTNSAGVAVRF
jgi:hypothetical protein